MGFACKTCDPDGTMGFCLGCSLNCHLDHEIFELWEKRAWRCDCGTKENPCKLDTSLKSPNEKNYYNHNFVGRYCYCDREYVIGGDNLAMIQCSKCQDWFHYQCLSIHLEDSDEFFDEANVGTFLCKPCALTAPFLAPYSNARIRPESEIGDSSK